MGENLSDKDRQLRAAIDEWEQAKEELARAMQEGTRWQQENPEPERPQSIQSLTEIEEYERKSKEWSEPYREQRGKVPKAQVRLREAENTVVKLLPPEYNYVYRGKRYYVAQGAIKIR